MSAVGLNQNAGEQHCVLCLSIGFHWAQKIRCCCCLLLTSSQWCYFSFRTGKETGTSFQMTQNLRGSWDTRVMVPARGTQAEEPGWQEAPGVTRKGAEPYTWGGTAQASYVLGEGQLESSLAGKHLEGLVALAQSTALLTDSQKLSGHDAGQLAVGGPAWSMELDQVTSREPFRLHSICNSVLLWVITLWGEAEALVFNLVSEFWRKNGLRWKHFLHILLSKLKCAKGVMGHGVQLNTQGKAASQAL